MYVMRPVKEDDFTAILRLVTSAGTGFITLTHNPQHLKEKIKISMLSFEKSVSFAADEHYFFVLEDLENGTLGGCCAIIAKVQSYKVYYEVETLDIKPSLPQGVAQQKILRACPQSSPASEVCSLFMASALRHKGLGKLVSLSRFFFMATHPQRFCEETQAEIRGTIDAHAEFPFWNGIGRHFLDLPFHLLMKLRQQNEQLIVDSVPEFPIYLSLLPPEVREAIGMVHPNSRPALQILEDEGFRRSDKIDICDGGPLLSACTKEIRSIRSSAVAVVSKIGQQFVPPEAQMRLLANNALDFRACLGTIAIEGTEVALPENIATALHVGLGDTIRFAL